MSTPPTIDYSKFIIERGPLWTAQLHDDQTYLGRMIIALNRPAEIDWLDLEDADYTEYFRIARRCKQALTELFAPDMFNHATLRNEWRQQHVHLIPRYIEKREFAGLVFEDKRWGKNWPPYDKVSLPMEKLMEIRAAISAKMALTT